MISFNPWEINFLQSVTARWAQFKAHGAANFSDEEMLMVKSIRAKVIAASVDRTGNVLFTNDEKDFLESILEEGKMNSSKPAGDLDRAMAQDVAGRSIALIEFILAKIRGVSPRIVGPGLREGMF
jgi:hypothetical protein